MPLSKDFIEVHALVDGKVASIRAESIDAVLDNSELKNEYGYVEKPECRTIDYAGGRSLDCTETYEDIMNMIWNAEL